MCFSLKKNARKNLIAIVMLGFCWGCGGIRQEQAPSGKIVIQGEIYNRDSLSPRTVRIIFTDPLYSGEKVCRLEKEGTFCVSNPAGFIKHVVFNYGGRYLNFYVPSGDTLRIKIDAEKFGEKDLSGVELLGKDAGLNIELNKIRAYPFVDCYAKAYDMNLPPSQFLAEIHHCFAGFEDSLAIYAEKEQFSPEAVEWTKRDFIFSLSNWISDYEGGASDPQDKKRDKLIVLQDSLFNLYHPGNFQTMMFPYHLSGYFRLIGDLDSNVCEAVKTEEPLAIIQARVDRGIKERSTLVRDYMIYDYLVSAMQTVPAILNSIQNIEMLFTQPVFVQRLREIAAEAGRQEYTRVLIDGVSYLRGNGETEALPEVDLLPWLAEKYPGKVLYIDAWATWCAPCRNEMQRVPAIHEKLSGKDVVFVYLCLYSEFDQWKNSVNEMNNGGEHYFLDLDATNLFRGIYQFSGVPVYFLVDKQGKLVTVNAKRPSDFQGLLEQISALLL